jgi:hypothetical protein
MRYQSPFTRAVLEPVISSPTSESRLGLMVMPDGSLRFIGKDNHAMLDKSLSPQDGALTCK